MKNIKAPREGEIYKVLTVQNKIFEIRYGYYDENERDRVEPLPIFPDLKANPVFTSDGKRIVTAIQDPCKRYNPKNEKRSEKWCGDCIYYLNAVDEISICGCTEKQLE